MTFRVELDVFRGPLDLLLYLVRKHEVEITEIPIAQVTEQYLSYLNVIEQLDVDAAGEFLVMASTLIEIKSRMVLPRQAEAGEEPIDEPRQELIRRLLEYKKFKDAASILEERSRSWQDRFPRLVNDLAAGERDLAEEPLHELELWDLVSAFGRILRENEAAPGSSIVYDETPIHVFMERIHSRLQTRGQLTLAELFRPGMHKSTLVGIFLAILELVRHYGIRAEQNELFGQIWLLPPPTGLKPLEPAVGQPIRPAEGE
jgi:segregation and condensation protein A